MVLYHLHTHAHRICVKKISRPRTYINTHNCSVLFHMYITFLKNFIKPDDGNRSFGRRIYLVSYINLIIQFVMTAISL